MSKELINSFTKKTLQDYEVISVLGSGAYGTCYKVRDKETDKLYAWKAIDYDELSDVKLESLVSEISVLRQLQHPNIVQYYHHLNSHEAKSIFIIMEWCEGGDLSQLISRARSTRKRFEERYLWRVLFQLCRALQFCHNKLKKGIVLHRDIKPANIFLDAFGNAKLGDFGLARMLRRNQTFADAMVGTPYYMSPEIINGERYDCRTDVWALGCLTYEMAVLKPPFRGNQMKQLSLNISNGEYEEISFAYSKDLHEIIRFMLEVDESKRPSVEMIARHPNVVRNITELENKIEPLVDAEADFMVSMEKTPRQRLQYRHSTSILSSNDNSCYDDPQRLGVSGVFTPDLRTEIFYSANRKLYPRALQQSDSELYKTTRQCMQISQKTVRSPNAVTEKIFNEFLQERLHAIRAHESLLKQKEENLAALELKLNEREHRLDELQRKLDQRHANLENKLRNLKPNKSSRNSVSVPSNGNRSSKSHKRLSTISAPPEKKSMPTHDETYCSIDPQDAQSPTMAKLNLATLPTSRAFPTRRKVTFQSPKIIINYDIEKVSPNRVQKLRNSICSSSDGSNSDATTQRRKSLLSLLGIKRSSKEPTKIASDIEDPPTKHTQRSEQILSKCEPEKLTNIWTKENQRAAFHMLAAMKASESSKSVSACRVRQSMRASPRLTQRRNRLRQSMKV